MEKKSRKCYDWYGYGDHGTCSISTNVNWVRVMRIRAVISMFLWMNVLTGHMIHLSDRTRWAGGSCGILTLVERQQTSRCHTGSRGQLFFFSDPRDIFFYFPFPPQRCHWAWTCTVASLLLQTGRYSMWRGKTMLNHLDSTMEGTCVACAFWRLRQFKQRN